MPQLPVEIWKAVGETVQVILSPSAKRVASGLLALVEAVVRGQSKSHEELIVEAVEAGIAADDRRIAAIQRLREIARDPDVEHQRILAREAASLVPSGRFVLPALPIAGRVFRDSEFEDEGSPVWKMWAQLLARACDKERVGEAHPAFPWIISQLSSDEARLLEALAHVHPRTSASHLLEHETIPKIATAQIGIKLPANLGFYLGHIGSLGLTVQPFGFEPTAHVVMIDEVRTYMLASLGRTFIAAVTAPPRGTN